jgi:hypothetical protein
MRTVLVTGLIQSAETTFCDSSSAALPGCSVRKKNPLSPLTLTLAQMVTVLWELSNKFFK